MGRYLNKYTFHYIVRVACLIGVGSQKHWVVIASALLLAASWKDGD